MLYEIWYVTITIALLMLYFTLLRKVINLKMVHNQSGNMSLNETMLKKHTLIKALIVLYLTVYGLYLQILLVQFLCRKYNGYLAAVQIGVLSLFRRRKLLKHWSMEHDILYTDRLLQGLKQIKNNVLSYTIQTH